MALQGVSVGYCLMRARARCTVGRSPALRPRWLVALALGQVGPKFVQKIEGFVVTRDPRDVGG